MVQLYSESVLSVFVPYAELKVRDQKGNVTTLSPHNFSLIHEGSSEPLSWAHYTERDGKAVNADMLKALRIIENLSGEKLVYTSGIEEHFNIIEKQKMEYTTTKAELKQTKDENAKLRAELESVKARLVQLETAIKNINNKEH